MTIFIQIAAYRDPQLPLTIKDCIRKAFCPENLRFGIARQFKEEDGFDDLSEFVGDQRFKVLNIPFEQARGACWARNRIQEELFAGEDFTLQIDSHMRFERGWDFFLVSTLKKLQSEGVKKPLLTSYAAVLELDKWPYEERKPPTRMYFDKFTPEGVVFFLFEDIPNWRGLADPVPSRFYSAHFAFTLGSFCREVPHDPNLYFHGEEISIAVRAFTAGYDLFHPHRTVIYHEYTRNGRPKQWDDDKSWTEKNAKSLARNRRLLGVDGEGDRDCEERVGKFGLGRERSLRDYERYAGILFTKRAVQQETIDRSFPPNKEVKDENDWLLSFSKRFKYTIDLSSEREAIEKEEKELQADGDAYDFWAVIFSNSECGGREIHRKDETTTKPLFSIAREFDTVELPSFFIVWPHAKKKGWCRKITKKV